MVVRQKRQGYLDQSLDNCRALLHDDVDLRRHFFGHWDLSRHRRLQDDIWYSFVSPGYRELSCRRSASPHVFEGALIRKVLASMIQSSLYTVDLF